MTALHTNTEFEKLTAYLRENADIFYAAGILPGESQYIPYVLIVTDFGTMVKIEYSTEKRIANVIVSDPRTRVKEHRHDSLTRHLMQQNVRNAVGHWVIFQDAQMVAYKTCVKFPSALFSSELVGECILACLSSFHHGIIEISDSLEPRAEEPSAHEVSQTLSDTFTLPS